MATQRITKSKFYETIRDARASLRALEAHVAGADGFDVRHNKEEIEQAQQLALEVAAIMGGLEADLDDLGAPITREAWAPARTTLDDANNAPF